MTPQRIIIRRVWGSPRESGRQTIGIIRVLEERLRYRVLDSSPEVILEPGRPGLIFPEQSHIVEPLGLIRMQIEFYDHLPEL